MSSTSVSPVRRVWQRTTGTTHDGAGTAPRSSSSARVMPPPKQRRRPLLVAASVITVCLGALLSVWVYSSLGTAQDALAMRVTVPRGSVISADALTRVRIGVDPAVHPVPADQAGAVVGKRAAVDLAAGGLLTVGSITDAPVPASGESLVGVALSAASMPGQPLLAGDRVRIVATPGEQGDLTGTPKVIVATVVALHDLANASAQSVVDVSVPADQAAELAARAATGKVALVLDSRER